VPHNSQNRGLIYACQFFILPGLKNKFLYQLLTAASQVMLPLVTYPYITRVLGPANLGKVNYVDFLSQAFMILASFGIPFYATREIATARNDVFKRTALIKEFVLLQAVFCFAAIFLFGLFAFNNFQTQFWLYAIGAANILISSFSFEWYLQGMEHFKFAAVRMVLVRLAVMIAFFVLVKAEGDYVIYFSIISISMAVIAILNGYKILQENNFAKQPVNPARHLVPLWHFFLTSSAVSIYVYLDTILLQNITQDETQVGYYTTALKMVKIFLMVILAMSAVLLPRMSFLAGENRKEEIKIFLSKYAELVFVAGLPVSIGLYMLAPEIIHTIAGEAFLPAVPLMRILSFLPLIIALSNMFCFQVLVPFKQERKFLLAAFIGCIASVSLNYWLIPSMKAEGAALSCLATELVVTIATGIMAWRIMPWDVNTKSLLQSFFLSLLFIPLILLCRKITTSPYAVLSISLLLCSVFYFAMQYFVFGSAIVKGIKQHIQQILKR